MKISHDPSASRYEHVGKGLRRSDLNPDPIKQFGIGLLPQSRRAFADVTQ